jgi:hypothetical protein
MKKGGLLFFKLVFWVGLLVPQVSFSQESSTELWPEIDAWFRLSPDWRFSVYLPLSRNFETNYREGNLVLQADYVWGKANSMHLTRLYDENRTQKVKPYMVRGGYLAARSLDDKGEAYSEEMVYGEFHLRNPFQYDIMISHRFRAESRWIGDESEHSMRFRYRFMIEKEWSIKKLSIVPYVNVEPYFDTRYSQINRIRAIGGATWSWHPAFALETNFTYQYDSKSSVTNLYAINIIAHLFFDVAGIKAATAYKPSDKGLFDTSPLTGMR